ncbi:hypothetical protein [Acidithiobacillus caldus]|uniref:Uncharacterized protein n=1 Tax=Acidithiobacillus caldus TaxID=33059 RepID=A0A1E7YIR8_9PROT|nr:hypothetical protein [Acidithiobacillus caldus]OFC28661.1 hypothetical protein BAE27_15320 [Acidithiobacillus caldus]OFC37991.1 hypothetical protein BAE28_06485 [Acidithiobacillus caldus]OFC39010.1 hypothetical protein BAE29_08090 [Acidithiobacillus caldus]
MSLANEKPNVGATAAGETPQPKAQAEVKESGYDLVEKSLPDSEHKHLARWVQRYNLSDDDPMFGAYLAARVSFASAAAAGEAATVVEKAVKGLPEQIYANAVRAGDDVAKTIEARGEEVSQSIVKSVTAAGNHIKGSLEQVFSASVGSICAAADGAAAQAKAARDAIIRSGVQEYQQRAAQAIEQQMAGYRIEKQRDAFLFGAFVVAAVSLGACAVTVSVLEKLHYLAPHPIQMTSVNHRNCGVAVIDGFGRQYVCVLNASIQPAPPIPAPQ